MFLVAVPDSEWNFSTAFASLRAVVQRRCEREPEGPAKVAAGIREALDFAAAYPDAARALIMGPQGDRPGDPGDYREMIEFFGRLLGAMGLPRHRRPNLLHDAVVGSIAGIVGSHIRTGRHDRLPNIAPELVQLTLLPYVGFDEAKRWADHPGARVDA